MSQDKRLEAIERLLRAILERLGGDPRQIPPGFSMTLTVEGT